jgi:hypothetical protein
MHGLGVVLPVFRLILQLTHGLGPLFLITRSQGPMRHQLDWLSRGHLSDSLEPGDYAFSQHPWPPHI